MDVVLSNWDVVEPDLLLIAANQPDILTAKNVQGPPALVIEVLSPGTRSRDRRLKRDLFERAGVREYWLVDPEANTVTVYRRSMSDGFGRPQVLPGDELLATPLLPGFGLSLRELFA
ncbi:MAG: Uma2 family endonuclease [Acidobacteria bacterium]|nr:Uma2 family endonuclease [Acidobacteriota bacterium]